MTDPTPASQSSLPSSMVVPVRRKRRPFSELDPIPPPPEPWRLLTNKELAQTLNVSLHFVDDMIAAGFERIDTRCFYSDAAAWLRQNPRFREHVKGN